MTTLQALTALVIAQAFTANWRKSGTLAVVKADVQLVRGGECDIVDDAPL